MRTTTLLKLTDCHTQNARLKTLNAWLVALLLLPAFVGHPAEAAPARVNIVLAPENCLAPDVAMDTQGVLHMVYGRERQAWYVHSANHGRTFTPPVKVNASGNVETKMGERGPKLAAGENGVIHVVWMDEWAPGVKTFVRYTRSLDLGRTFEPLQAISSMSGIDGVTVAADGQGHVVAFWHVMAEPKPTVKAATWLHMAQSTNDGAAFGPSERVVITNHSGLACSMCMMRARARRDGSVRLAFRSAEDNLRDFYVLTGRITENRFAAVRVNQDDWRIDYCPMCGPELTFTAEDQAVCAFMSRNKVYWTLDSAGLDGFRLHVPTPANEEDEIYPMALANRRGDVLFLWQVGPMAVKGTAMVKWARYDRSGKPTGESGVVGKSFAGTKATAFVGADDDFYIVTTAAKQREKG